MAHILVVDDEPAMLQLIRRVLEKDQHFVSRNSKSHYGIGLYVAASIAKKHKGKIILENSAAAGGAKVTIQIPY